MTVRPALLLLAFAGPAASGGCRGEAPAGSSSSPVATDSSDAQRREVCWAAAAFVRDTYQAASRRFDEPTWQKLISSFDGESRRVLARAGDRLRQAQSLSGGADSLIRAAGEPHNRGGAPHDVSTEVAALRLAAQKALVGLDAEVQGVVSAVHGLPQTTCERIQAATGR